MKVVPFLQATSTSFNILSYVVGLIHKQTNFPIGKGLFSSMDTNKCSLSQTNFEDILCLVLSSVSDVSFSGTGKGYSSNQDECKISI